MSTLLNKKIVSNPSLSDDAFLAYIALRKLLNQQMQISGINSFEDCVSCHRLCYILAEQILPCYVNTIYQGIKDLDALKLITVKQEFSTSKSHEFIINLKNIYCDALKDLYIVIKNFEIKKLLNCTEIRSEKRIALLRYLITLIGTFNNSSDFDYGAGKIGYMPITYIAHIASISESTAKRYNKILSELKLIYIYKAHDAFIIDGRLRQITNTYSRYSDRSICISFGKEKENKGYNHQVVTPRKTKQQADHNRSLAQKYHTILNWYSTGQPCKYEKSLVEEIYKYVSNKNKSLQQMIDEKTSQLEQSGQISKSEEEYIDRLRSQIRDTEVLKSIIDNM